MIFQQEKVFSSHKKKQHPSFFVATLDGPSWDGHSGWLPASRQAKIGTECLGFILELEMKRTIFWRFLEISNQKSLKPTKQGGSALKWEGEAAEKLSRHFLACQNQKPNKNQHDAGGNRFSV